MTRQKSNGQTKSGRRERYADRGHADAGKKKMKTDEDDVRPAKREDDSSFKQLSNAPPFFTK